MTNRDDILSDDDLDAVSGGRGTTSSQPVSDKQKRRVPGSSPGNDTITTTSGTVIGFEDDDGSSAPVESAPDTKSQQDEAKQTENTIQTRRGIVIEFEDDDGSSTSADAPNNDDSSQKGTDEDESSIRTQSGTEINFEDGA